MTLTTSMKSFASSKDENPIIGNVTYYGVIKDIIELDYYGHFNVVLFKCDWFEAKQDEYGLTYVYFNKLCYSDDPFVLATQVHQCFYVQDPYDENCHYVMKTIPRDLFNMREQLDTNCEEFYWSEPFDLTTNAYIHNDVGDVDDWVRVDLPATIIDKPQVFIL